MPPTPWANYVEAGEHPFQMGYDKGGNFTVAIFDAVGNHCSCHGNLRTKSIFTSPDSGKSFQPTELYDWLDLDSWGRPERAVLMVHPFALVHMYVAEQVPLSTLQHIAQSGRFSLGYSVLIQQRCRLLEIIGQLELMLGTSTAYDIEYKDQF